MIKFNINIHPEMLEAAKRLTIDKQRKVLMKAMFKMEELAIHKAPFDRGILREKITLFPQILADKYVLTSGAPYSAAMEYGSRPFYAPIKPLKEWARRKLGNAALGYAVQAKIAKEGVRAQPFFRPSLLEVNHHWLPQYMKEALE